MLAERIPLEELSDALLNRYVCEGLVDSGWNKDADGNLIVCSECDEPGDNWCCYCIARELLRRAKKKEASRG